MLKFRIKLRTTLLYFDTKDINELIYKKENINLNNLNIRLSNNDVIYGQLYKSDDFDIGLRHISHSITNIYIQNNKLIGEITILNTEPGKLLEILLKISTIKKDLKLSVIEKIKMYRLLKSAKNENVIDLDLYNSPIVFRMRYDGFVNDKKEVIVKRIFTFDAICKEEDDFKNIIN